jgi:hypothetical protein
MHTYGMSAVFIGGLLLAPVSGAIGQDLAATPNPRAGYVVFLDPASSLSGPAVDTVRSAARAARSAPVVELVGRRDHVYAVKNELVREGVPAGSIVVRPDASRPLPKATDGVSEPLDRRVEIRF